MTTACLLPNGPLLYQWIDDDFINRLTTAKPTWFDQRTVTIRFDDSQKVDSESLNDITAYVVSSKRERTPMVEPGVFLDLYAKACDLYTDLETLVGNVQFESVPKELGLLHERLKTITYLVAITGPSRAGKSTLLNVLVGRNISPVDALPTTAVPIFVLPGRSDEAAVEFLNGDRAPLSLDHTEIAAYATQEHNRDNEKNVQRIEVYITHPLMQPGIGFVDAPGLHDPSKEMREATRRAIGSASAVLFILDIMPARAGGFAFRDQDIESLREVTSVSDRVFLILNKVDELNSEQRERTLTYVETELRRYKLLDAIADRPLMISAKRAFQAQQKGTDPNQHLDGLPGKLWGFLLRARSKIDSHFLRKGKWSNSIWAEHVQEQEKSA